MPFQDAFSIFIRAVPIIGNIWRWLLERNMEIELYAPRDPIKPPIMDFVLGERPHISLFADLVLTNHRADRKEKVIDCALHLKRRHWLLWQKTLAQTEVTEYSSSQYHMVGPPLKNIKIDEITRINPITIIVDLPLGQNILEMPKKTYLVIEFRMIGPIRKISKTLDIVIYDKRVNYSASSTKS